MFENPEVAFGGTSRLLSLIDLTYAAVGEPDQWQQVVDGIADAANGESTILWARFPQDSLVAHSRCQPGSWEEYAEYYSGVNVLMSRCDDRFPLGSVRYSHEVITNPEFERTEFYADFFRRWNMHYSFGIKVPLGNLPAAYISCQRPRSSGPFTEREGLVYQTMLPHLQRALTLHITLSHLRGQVEGLESALDAYGHAVFGLNSQGVIVLMNRAADALARRGDGIQVSDGRLRTTNWAEDASLQQALVAAVAGAAHSPSSPHGVLHVTRAATRTPLRVVVSPHRGTLTPSVLSVAALVFVIDPEQAPRSRATVLRSLFHLTPAESRIADGLLEGFEVAEVAERLGITQQTARFHVKRVLAKTGARRQSDLLRIMLTLPAIR